MKPHRTSWCSECYCYRNPPANSSLPECRCSQLRWLDIGVALLIATIATLVFLTVIL